MGYEIAKWRRSSIAAGVYGCTRDEIERWASKGLIYGHHVRGNNGGWLIQTEPKQFETPDIRIRERKQAA